MVEKGIKQFLDTLNEVQEHSLNKGSVLLGRGYNIYLKWFYWSASFAGVFNKTDWESYTTSLYSESLRTVESSLVLSIYGEYKPAVQVLRDWLEGMVGGIYFDLYSREGKLWEEGKCIDFGKSIKGIAKKNLLNNALRKEIGQLWGELSEYAHQKQRIGDFVSSGGQPFATYDEKSLQTWLIFLRRTFEVCNSILVYRYPQLLKTEEIREIMGTTPTS